MASVAASELVKQLISDDKVMIFSKTYCGYCKMVREIFDKINQNYNSVDLDEREDEEEMMEALKAITGSHTVPQVFINGKFIGGGTDIKRLNSSGKLVEYFK